MRSWGLGVSRAGAYRAAWRSCGSCSTNAERASTRSAPASRAASIVGVSTCDTKPTRRDCRQQGIGLQRRQNLERVGSRAVEIEDHERRTRFTRGADHRLDRSSEPDSGTDRLGCGGNARREHQVVNGGKDHDESPTLFRASPGRTGWWPARGRWSFRGRARVHHRVIGKCEKHLRNGPHQRRVVPAGQVGATNGPGKEGVADEQAFEA